RIVVGLPGWLRSIEEAGADEFLFAGNFNLAFVRYLTALRFDAGEESRERPELALRPTAAGAIVVTLGALQLDAQKQPRGAGRQVLRLELVDLVKHAGRGAVTLEGCCGNHLAHEAIEGGVRLQAFAQPGFRGGSEVGRVLRVDARQNPAAPDVGEVPREGVWFSARLLAVEQQFHPDTPLIGASVVEEIVCVGDGRDATGQVEIDAADKLGVVAEGSRRDAFLHLANGQQMVDALGQRFRIQRSGRGAGSQPTQFEYAQTTDAQPTVAHGRLLEREGHAEPW